MIRKIGVKACSLLLCLCILAGLASCQFGGSDSERFERFSNEVFLSSVASDGLTLHFRLRDPSAYGITEIPLLGDILPDEEEEDADYSETRKTLESFNYNKLTTDQQILYEIFDNNLRLNEASDKFDYYSEINGYYSGVQADLPFSFAEYDFAHDQDVENYFLLLGDVPRYFEDAVTYQKKRVELGLFMSDASLDETLKAMDEFTAEPEKNVLIASFTERLDEMPDLSSEKRQEYIDKNKDLVMNTILPAYQKLRSDLSSMRGSGKNDNGVCYLPDGKEYYTIIAQARTGLDITPDEMATKIDEEMFRIIGSLQILVQRDPAIFDKYEQTLEELRIPKDPAETIRLFETEADKYFPAIDTVDFTVNEVPKSLQSNTSAAFYVNPPLDFEKENVIYFNPAFASSDLSLASTLAHEGYPGHLYQTNYFRTVTDDLSRKVMGPLGYLEGWATYVESYIYDFLGVKDKNVIEYFQLFDSLNRMMSARVDIGIHYEGWTLAQLKNYMGSFGITDDEAISGTFSQILSNPGAFLPYTMGKLEIDRLRNKAQRELGDQFDLVAFHKALLDCGPAFFSTVEKRLDAYIEQAKHPDTTNGAESGTQESAKAA